MIHILGTMKFIGCDVMRGICEWTLNFGNDILKHPVDDCDSERVMTILTRINLNKLTKTLSTIENMCGMRTESGYD